MMSGLLSRDLLERASVSISTHTLHLYIHYMTCHILFFFKFRDRMKVNVSCALLCERNLGEEETGFAIASEC